MIQQVNLYQLELKKALSLTFQLATKLVGGMVVLLFLISFIEIIGHVWVKHELNTLEEEKSQASRELEKIKAKIPNPATKESYVEEIRRLEEEKKTKQDMLSVLTNLRETQSLGFSRYLKALASRVTFGLWLTNFSLEQDKNIIFLEGMTLKPDNVSHLIEGLSQEPVFQGKTFQVFRISVEEKTNTLQFELRTEEKQKS